VQRTGAVTIAAPELQLADDVPLVLDCGGETSPRFQLLELAPQAGTTFDPSGAQYRVLALLDVEAGRLVWTSKKILPPRRASVASAPICRNGHYFVPVDLGDSSSALLVIDAEAGTTTRAFAFDRAGGSFADLEADQIDGDRIVGVARRGPYELRWHDAPSGVPGVRDASAELERQLGRLP
jgi:hypothetical protein